MSANRTFFGLMVAALLAACGTRDDGGNSAGPLPPPDFTATAAHDGAILGMRPGDVLEVRLDGNSTIDPPVTWSVAGVPPHLRLNGERIESQSPGADGAGATWIFSFTAVAEGGGRLLFDGGESRQKVGLQVESAENLVTH